MMETQIRRVKNGQFILLPITDQTRGHGTHTIPAIWGGQLAAFLAKVRK
jgi:homoserine O-acetyltransferase